MATTASERIILQDQTCPIIRLEKQRRRDKSISFSISFILHAAILLLIGFSLIKPPQFGIDKGDGGIEVSLVAAEQPSAPQPVTPEVSEMQEESPQEAALPQSTPEESQNGKDQLTAQSSQGAISEAKPDYLKNPSPAYPESARRRGYEGTVLLSVVVAKDGSAMSVQVEQSSGHLILDEAAQKAVKLWKFKPARMGNIPIESTATVPVRFNLKDA